MLKPNSTFLQAAVLFTIIFGCQFSLPETNEDRWVEWIKKNAVQLDTLDPFEVDPAVLSFLDPLLEGKRIVFLGEPDHYIHEKYDYRLLLIKYLYQKGWRHIGMEMGRSTNVSSTSLPLKSFIASK